MLTRVLLGVLCLSAVFAEMQHEAQNMGTKQTSEQNQAQGNAAGAGTAGAQGQGDATSINTANHQANKDGTSSSGSSSNKASGTLGSNAGGAAQAGGQIQKANQLQANQASMSHGLNIAPIGLPKFGNNNMNMGHNNNGFPNMPSFPSGNNNGGFGSNLGGNSGFGSVAPSSHSNENFDNKKEQEQNAAGGNSAAAGNAGTVGGGSSSSINQANHEAGKDNTAASGLSANTAQGDTPSAGGAAQADGNIQGQKAVEQNHGAKTQVHHH